MGGRGHNTATFPLIKIIRQFVGVRRHITKDNRQRQQTDGGGLRVILFNLDTAAAAVPQFSIIGGEPGIGFPHNIGGVALSSGCDDERAQRTHQQEVPDRTPQRPFCQFREDSGSGADAEQRGEEIHDSSTRR
ncbi:hypothetical protein SDC9_212409 [bioreactor metagenome]|uniref:Uncharacterized protein n=1 Tax=bioreactor metagenome TaxID=1076179 RepID=A0A645K0C6_9ZZZZ